MRIPILTLSVLLLGSATALTQTAARTTPAACAALQQLQVSGVALSVTKSEWFAAGAPTPGGRGGAPTPSNLLAYRRMGGVVY